MRSGADPDAMDNDRWTPLHAAAHWSLADAAKVLTEYGANFGLENKNVSPFLFIRILLVRSLTDFSA